MLSSEHLVAFVPTRDPARAKIFYRDTLGLKLISEDQFALVFDANGTTLRVTIVRQLAPHPFTSLGWSVADVAASVRALQAAGITFEHFAAFHPDALGIVTTPDGTRVAWFKDPDGNMLSIGSDK